AKEKSIDVLLKSFILVLKDMPDTSLFMVGGGPFKTAYIQLAKEMGLEKDVIFSGEVPQTELLTNGYFQVGDVFATASTSELQPVSLSEAMYFKVPIVGVDEKGVPEMIKGSGLLSTPGNAEELAKNILSVLKDSSLKKQLSDNSAARYNDQYSRKAVMEAYEKLYADVIAAKMKK
ncbi:MAG: glycosyltransferase, partial [Patescibacteria group bacterium]